MDGSPNCFGYHDLHPAPCRSAQRCRLSSGPLSVLLRQARQARNRTMLLRTMLAKGMGLTAAKLIAMAKPRAVAKPLLPPLCLIFLLPLLLPRQVLAAPPSADRIVPGTRLAIDPFVAPEPGTFFSFIQQLSQPGGWLDSSLALLRFIDPSGRQEGASQVMNADRLSRRQAINYGDYQGNLMLLRALSLVHGPTLTQENLPRASTIVLFSDDSTQSLDPGMALRLNYAFLSLQDQALRARPRLSRSLAGRYRVSVTGDCPLTRGEVIEIREDGPYLEGVQGDRLRLIGVVGDQQVWLIIDQKYVVSLDQNPTTREWVIRAPDQPSPLLGGRIHPQQIDLHQEWKPGCHVLLQRQTVGDGAAGLPP